MLTTPLSTLLATSFYFIVKPTQNIFCFKDSIEYVSNQPSYLHQLIGEATVAGCLTIQHIEK